MEESLPFNLLDLTVKATVILLIAALATRLFRRSSSAIRHAVLTSALLSTVALPLLSRGLPRLEVPAFTGVFRHAVQTDSDERRASPARLIEPADESRISSSTQNDGGLDASLAPRSHPEDAVVSSDPALLVRLTRVGLAVWILGVLLMLLPIAVGEFRALCLKRASTEMQGSEWNRSLSEVTRQYKLIRRVTLLTNATISVPMTWGTIRPFILIPEGYRCPCADRRRILQHEIAHVIRCDVALQTAGRIACAFYWFHPLAWWCLRQMHCEREQACDDWVLRSGERPTEYADQLLALAKRGPARRSLPEVFGIVRNGNLEKPVLAILSNNCSHAAMGRVRGALLIALTACLCAAVAVVHSRPLIAANLEDQKDGSKDEPSAQDVESKSDPTKDG